MNKFYFEVDGIKSHFCTHLNFDLSTQDAIILAEIITRQAIDYDYTGELNIWDSNNNLHVFIVKSEYRQALSVEKIK